jgi:purine-binding chemotaxis protein CheW
MSNTLKLVVFALDAQKFALYLSSVERVVPVVEITQLPKAPDIVTGIINVQGRIIPVVNIRKRFQLPMKETDLTDKLVISQTTRRTAAIIVDAVCGVIEYPEQKIITAENVLPGMEYIDGVVKADDGMILIHDLDKFLSLDEEEALNKALISKRKNKNKR